MLTKEQRLTYVTETYCKCPVCGSGQIEGDSFDGSDDIAWQKLWCNECEYEWIDTYALCDVQTRTYGDDDGEPDMATVRELRKQLHEITAASARVVESWENGNLAEAVRELNRQRRASIAVLDAGLTEEKGKIDEDETNGPEQAA